MASRRRDRYRGPLWLIINAAALMTVALLFRAYHLANIPGVNGDEAWSGVQALRLLRGESVDWLTPNGNPLNGFFFLPSVALHAVAPPSFVLLRLASLASGVLALVANYFLCRRAFDNRTAVVSTWLLALLPIDIAYSRFAWDASQSLLATLGVMYLPLIYCRARVARASLLIAAMIALAAAVWVHPTNVFAAPLLLVPVLCRSRHDLASTLKNTAVADKTWTLAVLAAVSAVVVYGAWQGLAAAVVRLHGPVELGHFIRNYLRLFSGTTVYEFISGLGFLEANETWFAYLPPACDLLFGCAAIGGLLGISWRLSRRPTICDVALVLGWLTMLLGFFLVAGPGAIAAHHERYGICLIAPGALVMSRGLAWWIDEHQPRRQMFAAALAVAAWLWPVSFYFGYFAFFEKTGGCSHPTFRTAAVEPKSQALRFILERRKATESTRIVCREWWNYWPLEYLAGGQDNVRVLTWEQWQDTDRSSNTRQVENTWFVEFADTPSEIEVLHGLQKAGVKVQAQTIYDYAHRPLISIIGPAENFSRNY